MWWKLVGLGLIEVGVVWVVFFIPIETHAVIYTTPESARGHENEMLWQGVFAIGGLVAVVAALGIPIWLAWRVVRRHRNSN